MLLLACLACSLAFISCDDDDHKHDDSKYHEHQLIADKLINEWSLNSGTYTWYYDYMEEFRWLDDDCENVAGNPVEYWDKFVFTKSQFFNEFLVHYEQEYTTNKDLEYYNPVYGELPGKEYEDALTIKRDINYSHKLDIREDGSYICTITYMIFEDDYPLPETPAGSQQFGLTYQGQYSYISDWTWIKNDIGNTVGIALEAFPFLQFGVNAQFDLDLEFSFNWIEDIAIQHQNVRFQIEESKMDTLILSYAITESGFYPEVENEWQGLTLEGINIDCEGTFSVETLEFTECELTWAKVN